MKTIVHVHRQALAQNRKDGGDRPAIIVRTYKGTTHHHEVECAGPVRIVQAEKPLSCGARTWIETQGEVHVIR